MCFVLLMLHCDLCCFFLSFFIDFSLCVVDCLLVRSCVRSVVRTSVRFCCFMCFFVCALFCLFVCLFDCLFCNTLPRLTFTPSQKTTIWQLFAQVRAGIVSGFLDHKRTRKRILFDNVAPPDERPEVALWAIMCKASYNKQKVIDLLFD